MKNGTNDLINVFGRPNRVLTKWKYRSVLCPNCEDVIIEIRPSVEGQARHAWRMVYPAGASRGPVSPTVPAAIAADYTEACNVLPISPKASAALSRRCLQNMLRSNGYTARDLAHEIDLLLAESDPLKALPGKLRSTVQRIRHFGNFSAHPTIDKGTLDILDVEEHESEWCLETIEELFEHFYVGPALAKAKKAALDQKLAAAGKPASKG